MKARDGENQPRAAGTPAAAAAAPAQAASVEPAPEPAAPLRAGTCRRAAVRTGRRARTGSEPAPTPEVAPAEGQ